MTLLEFALNCPFSKGECFFVFTEYAKPVLGSDIIDMYKRHYEIPFKYNWDVETSNGGRLRSFMNNGRSLTKAGIESFIESGYDNVEVDVVKGDHYKSYCYIVIKANGEDSYNDVLYMFEYKDDDPERSISKWQHRDIKTISDIADDASLHSLRDCMNDITHIDADLSEVIDKALNFDWLDESAVDFYLTDYDKTTLTLVDYTAAKKYEADKDYLEKMKNYFDGSSVEFNSYRNGYSQNCPNPSNFSFDHPGSYTVKITL